MSRFKFFDEINGNRADDLIPEQHIESNTSNFHRLQNDTQHPGQESLAGINEVKYRCEQENVTKMNGIPVSNSIQKFQYSVKINQGNNIAQVKLEDHYYSMNPPVLNKIFDFITQTEFIKNDLLFKIDKNGKLDQILNLPEQEKKWIDLKESKEFETEFIRTLGLTNPEGLKQLIEEGDNQFLSSRDSSEEHRRNLFIWILFDKHLYQSEEVNEPDIFLYQSHLVPPLSIPLKVKEEIITQDNENSTWRKTFTTDLNVELVDQIKSKYDEMHKPTLHYSFTNYNLDIYLTKEVSKESRFIEVAKLRITEEIENNVESYCEFTVRKL